MAYEYEGEVEGELEEEFEEESGLEGEGWLGAIGNIASSLLGEGEGEEEGEEEEAAPDFCSPQCRQRFTARKA